jgi:hypothetical protein
MNEDVVEWVFVGVVLLISIAFILWMNSEVNESSERLEGLRKMVDSLGEEDDK